MSSIQESSSFDYYVVDKIQNDRFLEDENSQYDYTNRPWAKGFATEEEAFGFADQQQNRENIEIETPEGVYGFENGWGLVFYLIIANNLFDLKAEEIKNLLLFCCIQHK